MQGSKRLGNTNPPHNQPNGLVLECVEGQIRCKRQPRGTCGPLGYNPAQKGTIAFYGALMMPQMAQAREA